MYPWVPGSRIFPSQVRVSWDLQTCLSRSECNLQAESVHGFKNVLTFPLCVSLSEAETQKWKPPLYHSDLSCNGWTRGFLLPTEFMFWSDGRLYDVASVCLMILSFLCFYYDLFQGLAPWLNSLTLHHRVLAFHMGAGLCASWLLFCDSMLHMWLTCGSCAFGSNKGVQTWGRCMDQNRSVHLRQVYGPKC